RRRQSGPSCSGVLLRCTEEQRRTPVFFAAHSFDPLLLLSPAVKRLSAVTGTGTLAAHLPCAELKSPPPPFRFCCLNVR
ncbi:hypothetical protein U1Q18_045226, partial [Sarracenia purpurea var. burkii]